MIPRPNLFCTELVRIPWLDPHCTFCAQVQINYLYLFSIDHSMANDTAASFAAIEPILVAYYALVLMILGTILNSLTFIIFFRGKFRDTHERPTIPYMRAIAIIDILMLYGWNFDHYMKNIYGFTIRSTAISACKMALFINYFAPQASAWLRVFICLDRYLSLSRLHRTWFGYSENVLIIIASICVFFILFNSHIPILACFYNAKGSISSNTDIYQIIPLWDWVNLGVYNGIPSVFMVILQPSKSKRDIMNSLTAVW
jgi:hypothetical protein